MSVRQIVALVTVLIAATSTAQAAALLPQDGCNQSGLAKTCAGRGEITVRGSHRTAGHHARGASAQPTVRYLSCGSSLPALSVSDATFATADCRIAPQSCASATTDDGRPRTARVTVRKEPDGSWRYAGWTCVAVGPPRITAAMVSARASRLIPRAAIGLAPERATLVNIQTVFWVDAPSRRALSPITILGRSLRITIRLDHVDWSFGDGAHATSSTAGKAYDADGDPCDTKLCADYFGHVDLRTGTMSITAQVAWRASFTVGAGGPVTIPGTVDGPLARASIHVKQARGILVPNP